MEYDKLLVEDNFAAEPAGFYSRTLWFLDCKAYPGIFEILRAFALRHLHKSEEEMIDYDVFIIIDPHERDFHVDLLYDDHIIEAFDPMEGQRVQQFADIISDVAYSVAHAVPF